MENKKGGDNKNQIKKLIEHDRDICRPRAMLQAKITLKSKPELFFFQVSN
jgi:hypothetical protein